MRGKIIYRMACGTCCVCMTYGLIAYALRPNDESETIEEWAMSAEKAVVTVAEPSAMNVANGTEYGNIDGKRGKNRGRGDYYGSRGSRNYDPEGNGNQTGIYASSSSTREPETSISESSDTSETIQQDNASGNPPSLSAFLSGMRCGGCRHNCSLLNPRCRKGKTKQQNATVQYQETYGG